MATGGAFGRRLARAGATGALLALAGEVGAATYSVGPGKPFPDLGAVAPLLMPGDVVNVEGGVTYAGGVVLTRPGAQGAPVILHGVRVGGRRPVLSGSSDTLELRGDHYIVEGFEVTGATNRCIFHHAADILIRDTVVHDCARHGILGADQESGSLTLDYVEVYDSGRGEQAHPIYMATDETAHPGSVFRMMHCYVHDGRGGNNVKSRAERNQIYYNWIEGAAFHSIELIGPDGQDPALAREDSDVVGNVVRSTSGWYAVRIGGDGTGATAGRYRFVSNTFLMARGSRPVFRAFDAVESVEMHDNAFVQEGGGGVAVFSDVEASWVTGQAVIAGAGNWVPGGSTMLPAQWTSTRTGVDPGFVGPLDPHPTAGSALRGAAVLPTRGAPGHDFPRPLPEAVSSPPLRCLEPPGSAADRAAGGDIGAYAAALSHLSIAPGPTRSGEPAQPAPSTFAPAGCGCRRTATALREDRALGLLGFTIGAALIRRRRSARPTLRSGDGSRRP